MGASRSHGAGGLAIRPHGPAAVPILRYQSVGVGGAPQLQRRQVTPWRLAAHLHILAEHGWTPVGLRALMEARHGFRRLPERPYVVTFDEGFADFVEQALPVLDLLAVPATVFVTTHYLGGTATWLDGVGGSEGRMLSAGQVAELSRTGVEVGGHGHTHAMLDLLTPAQARGDLTRCHEILAELLGRPPVGIAYPHGYSTPLVRRIASEVGFPVGLGVGDRLHAAADPAMDWARLRVTSEMSGEDLVRHLHTAASHASLLDTASSRAWRVVRRATRGAQQRDLAEAG